MYDQIHSEITTDKFYSANFPNEGQRFVAWYLRRVLLLDQVATRAAIVDGKGDKQIDAIVIEDGEDRRIRVIQGKFVKPAPIDAEPLREVLAGWTRLKDIPTLQMDASARLAERLEAARVALEDEYDLSFELLTTGSLTEAARADFEAFRNQMDTDAALGATLDLVDTEMLRTRLSEAEQRDLPELTAELDIDLGRCLVTQEGQFRVVVAMLPITQCLKLPGIVDGKLFRKNVRQSLGMGNKVNKGLRDTLADPMRRPYFFFFHNGITATCRKFDFSTDKKKLRIENLSVVNGCQSLSTMYSTSGKLTQDKDVSGSVLFRFYEISQPELLAAISINTNSQSAVKPRDLRSNDKYMIATKRRYELGIPDGYFITKRGEERPANKDPEKCIDASDYGKAVLAWMCQRPNRAYAERNLFDEYYKVVFHREIDASSMLALRRWLGEIDGQWHALDLNDSIKAIKGQVRFHILFVVSQLFAYASGQVGKVPIPAATVPALSYSGLILGQAVNCMNQALQHAKSQSEIDPQKVFSPQNWLKVKASVSDGQLVAGTIVNVLKSMASTELAPAIKSLQLKPGDFAGAWVVD